MTNVDNNRLFLLFFMSFFLVLPKWLIHQIDGLQLSSTTSLLYWLWLFCDQSELQVTGLNRNIVWRTMILISKVVLILSFISVSLLLCFWYWNSITSVYWFAFNSTELSISSYTNITSDEGDSSPIQRMLQISTSIFLNNIQHIIFC